MANVEGALIDAVSRPRGIFFHSMNPAATRVLKLAHADIWSIGNNHTMDAGREGVISTKNIAKRWDAVPSARLKRKGEALSLSIWKQAASA